MNLFRECAADGTDGDHASHSPIDPILLPGHTQPLILFHALFKGQKRLRARPISDKN